MSVDLRDALTVPWLSDSEKLYAAAWLQASEQKPEPFAIYSFPCAELIAEALGWKESKARQIEEGLRAKAIRLPSPEDMELARLRQPVTAKQRKAWTKEIGDSQGWKCFYCKLPGDGATCGPDHWRWVLEHKRPLSRGGLSIKENMVISCHRCNVKKRNRTDEEFQREATACD